MRRRGFTLIEVLITASLLLLAMVLTGQLAVVGMRTRMHTEDKNEAFRGGTLMLDQFNRDVAHSTRVVKPATMAEGVPQHGLVLETWSSRGTAGSHFIGYTFNPSEHTVTRLIYDPGFVENVAATHKAAPNERPMVCNWVQSFDVTPLPAAGRHGTHQLRCEMSLSAGEPDRPQPGLKLMTEVEVRGP